MVYNGKSCLKWLIWRYPHFSIHLKDHQRLATRIGLHPLGDRSDRRVQFGRSVGMLSVFLLIVACTKMGVSRNVVCLSPWMDRYVYYMIYYMYILYTILIEMMMKHSMLGTLLSHQKKALKSNFHVKISEAWNSQTAQTRFRIFHTAVGFVQGKSARIEPWFDASRWLSGIYSPKKSQIKP